MHGQNHSESIIQDLSFDWNKRKSEGFLSGAHICTTVLYFLCNTLSNHTIHKPQELLYG